MNPTKPPAGTTPELYRPVWADPGFAMALNDFRVTDVTLAAGTVGLLAKNNPKRWALAFFPAIAGGADLNVAPWPDANVYGVPIPLGGSLTWFTLFSHGPVVTAEWYGVSMAGFIVRVLEIEVG